MPAEWRRSTTGYWLQRVGIQACDAAVAGIAPIGLPGGATMVAQGKGTIGVPGGPGDRTAVDTGRLDAWALQGHCIGRTTDTGAWGRRPTPALGVPATVVRWGLSDRGFALGEPCRCPAEGEPARGFALGEPCRCPAGGEATLWAAGGEVVCMGDTIGVG